MALCKNKVQFSMAQLSLQANPILQRPPTFYSTAQKSVNKEIRVKLDWH